MLIQFTKASEKNNPKWTSIRKSSKTHSLTHNSSATVWSSCFNSSSIKLKWLNEKKSKDFCYFSKLIMNSNGTSEISQRIWLCSVTIDVLAIGEYTYTISLNVLWLFLFIPSNNILPVPLFYLLRDSFSLRYIHRSIIWSTFSQQQTVKTIEPTQHYQSKTLIRKNMANNTELKYLYNKLPETELQT